MLKKTQRKMKMMRKVEERMRLRKIRRMIHLKFHIRKEDKVSSSMIQTQGRLVEKHVNLKRRK